MEVVEKTMGCGSHAPPPNQSKSASFDMSESLQYFCNHFLHDAGSNNERLAAFLHPQGAVCPYCQTPVSARALKSFNNLKRCACKKCGKWFSATTGTLLQGCHNPRSIFLVAIFTALGTNTKQIAKLLNMHPTSIMNWQKKFRAK